MDLREAQATLVELDVLPTRAPVHMPVGIARAGVKARNGRVVRRKFGELDEAAAAHAKNLAAIGQKAQAAHGVGQGHLLDPETILMQRTERNRARRQEAKLQRELRDERNGRIRKETRQVRVIQLGGAVQVRTRTVRVRVDDQAEVMVAPEPVVTKAEVAPAVEPRPEPAPAVVTEPVVAKAIALPTTPEPEPTPEPRVDIRKCSCGKEFVPSVRCSDQCRGCLLGHRQHTAAAPEPASPPQKQKQKQKQKQPKPAPAPAKKTCDCGAQFTPPRKFPEAKQCWECFKSRQSSPKPTQGRPVKMRVGTHVKRDAAPQQQVSQVPPRKLRQIKDHLLIHAQSRQWPRPQLPTWFTVVGKLGRGSAKVQWQGHTFQVNF